MMLPCMHVCIRVCVLQDYRTVFGIQVSNKRYTLQMLKAMAFQVYMYIQ